jgi:hypothetical protein
MTAIEEQVRAALRDMAGEALPAPLLERLDQSSNMVEPRRTRWIAAAAAAVVATLVATGGVLISRWDRDPQILPTERPPRTLRLSETPSDSPGRARLVVTLARPSPVDVHEDPLYVLSATQDEAIRLSASERLGYRYSEKLSADGTRLIGMADEYDDAKLEIVNLVTGEVDELGDRVGFCPALSPDNRTVAAYSKTDLHIFDVDALVPRSLYRVSVPPDVNFCRGLGWSPDGVRIAAPTARDTIVLDRNGNVHHRFANRHPVNGASSWSPDSEQILLYDARGGSYTIARADGGEETVLGRPSDAQRPLGWTGSQVVWLEGQPGSYRLIAADPDGTRAHTWMEFDIGDRPVVTVSWSRTLAGTPSR